MNLSEIGFYTLSDERAKRGLNGGLDLERCEMILTDACNFKCPYCRGVSAYSRDCSGHIDTDLAKEIISIWSFLNLKNVRFSGGEPTLHPDLLTFVEMCEFNSMSRIAISTNGSRDKCIYENLIMAGVNDFSISLDACCAEFGDKMSGVKGKFNTVVENIKWLSKEVYTTVGIVLTEETSKTIVDIIMFAHDLGVNDIRIITAAQYNKLLSNLESIPQEILDAHPILKYRVTNLISGRNVRGISDTDSHKCYLVNDDMAVAGKWHFPCVIHMREGGEPIGEVNVHMMSERKKWFETHDTHQDPICKKNCLDCLIDYNNVADKNI